jgi:hypothetical protein
MAKFAINLVLLLALTISASYADHPQRESSRVNIYSAYQIVGNHVAVHGEVAEFREYFEVYILGLSDRYFVYNHRSGEIISGSAEGKFGSLDQAKNFLSGEYFAELANPELNPWIQENQIEPVIDGYGHIEPRVKIAAGSFLNHLDRGEVPAEFDLDRILRKNALIHMGLNSALLGTVCTAVIAVLYFTR